MTTYIPPAAVELPTPADAADLADLRRNRDAHLAGWEAQAFDRLNGLVLARQAREQAERSLVATAQHAGDDAAQLVKLAGGTVEAQADAYHAGYVKQARADGLAPVCHCQNCGKA